MTPTPCDFCDHAAAIALLGDHAPQLFCVSHWTDTHSLPVAGQIAKAHEDGDETLLDYDVILDLPLVHHDCDDCSCVRDRKAAAEAALTVQAKAAALGWAKSEAAKQAFAVVKLVVETRELRHTIALTRLGLAVGATARGAS